jgi:hypothetical protein
MGVAILTARSLGRVTRRVSAGNLTLLALASAVLAKPSEIAR